jgi:hypothetical protein
VFRVGLELKCPNCELPSWVHLDEVKTNSPCPYCDQLYDITAQLSDARLALSTFGHLWKK